MPVPVLDHVRRLQLLHQALDSIWEEALAFARPAAEQAALRMRMTRSVIEALQEGARDPETLRQAALKEIDTPTPQRHSIDPKRVS